MNRTDRRRRALRLGVMALGLLLVAYHLSLLAYRAGLFRSIAEVRPGTCRPVSGFLGPEDIAIDRERGIAWVTRADRFAVTQQGGAPAGGIERIDLTASVPEAVTLEPMPAAAFFPHGLDLWIGDDGERRLFVVAHGASGHAHSVEIFAIDEANALRHLETIRSDLFIDPNDIAATGPRSFYLTNLYGSRSAAGRFLENYLMLPRANVLHFDGRRARIVASGFRMANGIIASPDGGLVYVAEVIGRRVVAFARNPDDSLSRLGHISLPMGPDNLTLDPDGAIWAAGHPKLLAISARMRDPDHISPSEAIRIDPASGKWKTIWLDDGKTLGAASVAARWQDRLLIGAVFGPHLLECRLAGDQAG